MRPFDPELLAKLGNLRLRAVQLADGLMLGEHASLRKGVSTEFLDHQVWEPGNDPKFIDWRLFARTGKLFRRRFSEDTTMPVYLVVDKSGGMRYRGTRSAMSKGEYADGLAAALGFLALRQRDLLGVTLFNEARVSHLKAASGEAHWWESLDFLENPPLESAKTAIGSMADALSQFAAEFPQRGLVFVLSDFLRVERFDELNKVLKQLAAARQEVVLVQISDPDEVDFPFSSNCEFVSLFSGHEHQRANADELRTAYLEHRQRWLREFAEGCGRLNVRFVTVRTDTPLDVALKEICF